MKLKFQEKIVQMQSVNVFAHFNLEVFFPTNILLHMYSIQKIRFGSN